MRRFFADLHIHSRFSRATAKTLDPLTIGEWAKIKGLDLVGTGDMTHPGWLDRLEETLTETKDGLYRLADREDGPLFVPTGEISAIYSQGGRTRKIHLVAAAPNLRSARKFSEALGRRGNVLSDGRPILGLSARDILEIALTVDPEMEIIPAHIWTPWFSLFGSKSGFDALEDCFLDLSGHVRALETGLSSDPEMNRLISALDKYALVSSSDAHSPEKLGREATVMAGPVSWATLKSAFGGGPELVGTVEFFPEEGKYHLDGHVDCGPALAPAQTKEVQGICPVCGKPLTVGVLSRVLELADRSEALAERRPDWHLVPLTEVLCQVLDRGPTAKDVRNSYFKLVEEFGSEYGLLLETPLDDVKSFAGPLLARAIEKMRLGEVETSGGYDGKFGQIKVLSHREKQELSGRNPLFDALPARAGRRKLTAEPKPAADKTGPEEAPSADSAAAALDGAVVKRRQASGGLLTDLSSEQLAAVTFAGPALALTAGPGAGKTMVLVRRAAYLTRQGAAENMLLTTYTRKAAEELAQRLQGLLGPSADRVRVSTLHALALELASARSPDHKLAEPQTLDEIVGRAAKICRVSPRRFQNLCALKKNNLMLAEFASLTVYFDPVEGVLKPCEPNDLSWTELLRAPDSTESPGEERPVVSTERIRAAARAEAAALHAYQRELARLKLWDFDDLILEATRLCLDGFAPAFSAVLADEFQDFSLAQYALLSALSQKASSFTVIGDPEQSIYGFRGACGDIFEKVEADRPELVKMDLSLNFRSNPSICLASEAVRPQGGRRRSPVRPVDPEKIARAQLKNPQAEAAWVVERISAVLGVTSLSGGGSAAFDKEKLSGINFRDIAVLFRIRHLGEEVAKALDLAGFPWQMAGEKEETAADGLDFQADKISLLTMHAAKGLEFRAVFVIGLDEGLCPFELQDKVDLAEERRLFYVALTRAKDRLCLSRANARFLYGQPLSGAPSVFWSLLPAYICREFKAGPPKKKPAGKTRRLGRRLF
ncbi:MAG: UvrD-helicase domain-containing protein [Deltaproteobacteria bacterium]|jgi:DNA helicase-2/ATP-dependent DNA helicase PcrA|nr:UvrD-helicase domain-containing protein [Deltaproteobacteria bacterium]